METIKVEYKGNNKDGDFVFEIELSNGSKQIVEHNVNERGGTVEDTKEMLEDTNWRELIEWCLWDTWLDFGDSKDYDEELSMCESIMSKFDNKQPLEERELSLLNGLVQEDTTFTKFDYNTWVL